MKPKTTKKPKQTVSKFSFLTEPLTYAAAAPYIGNIPSQLKEIFSFHLGGTISAAPFIDWAAKLDFSGIMAWFCLNLDNPLTPKLFLAFESKNSFTYPENVNNTPSAWELTPDTGNLLIPNQRFGHNLSTIINHQAFLRKHIITPPDKDDDLHSSKVMEYCEKYLRDGLIKPFQKYGHGYFANSPENLGEDYLRKFLKQGDVQYVRYYFGFHPTAKPNFIRIILVPVDKEGRNIVNYGNRIEVQLLQKSVPPPPIL